MEMEKKREVPAGDQSDTSLIFLKYFRQKSCETKILSIIIFYSLYFAHEINCLETSTDHNQSHTQGI